MSAAPPYSRWLAGEINRLVGEGAITASAGRAARDTMIKVAAVFGSSGQLPPLLEPPRLSLAPGGVLVMCWIDGQGITSIYFDREGGVRLRVATPRRFLVERLLVVGAEEAGGPVILQIDAPTDDLVAHAVADAQDAVLRKRADEIRTSMVAGDAGGEGG